LDESPDRAGGGRPPTVAPTARKQRE
jgi:hypothetical protein